VAVNRINKGGRHTGKRGGGGVKTYSVEVGGGGKGIRARGGTGTDREKRILRKRFTGLKGLERRYG